MIYLKANSSYELYSSLPKTHIKTLEMFAMWMRDNDVKYITQGRYGEMFIMDDGEYKVDELISKFVKEDYGK